MKLVEGILNSKGIPSVLTHPEQVAKMIRAAVERGRFFIRIGPEENVRIFGGTLFRRVLRVQGLLAEHGDEMKVLAGGLSCIASGRNRELVSSRFLIVCTMSLG